MLKHLTLVVSTCRSSTSRHPAPLCRLSLDFCWAQFVSYSTNQQTPSSTRNGTGQQGAFDTLNKDLVGGDPKKAWAAFRALSANPEWSNVITPDIHARLLTRLEKNTAIPAQKKTARMSSIVEQVLGTASIASEVVMNLAQANLSLAWLIFEAATKKQVKLSYSAYSTLIGAIYKSTKTDKRQAQQIMTIYRQIKSAEYAVDPIIATMLLKRAAALGRAFEVFRELKAAGFKPDNITYATLAGIRCQRKEWDKAAGLMREMIADGFLPKDKIFRVAVQNLAKNGYIQAALDAKKMMEDAGVSTDIVMYTALIHACNEHRAYDEGRALFNEMRERGIAHNIVTYGVLIKGCHASGNVEEAERYFKQLLESGISPNAKIFNSMIALHMRAGNLPRAEELLEIMDKSGVAADSIIYGNFIDWYAKRRNHEKALRIIREMEKNKIVINGSSPYAPILDASLKEGRITEALDLFDSIPKDAYGNDDSLFSPFVHYYGQRRDLESMVAWHDKIATHGLKAGKHTYHAIMDTYAKKGLLDEADSWHRKLIKEIGDSQHSLAILMNGYNYAGQWDGVYKIWKRLRESGYELHDRTIAIFIDSCGYAGKLDVMEEELSIKKNNNGFLLGKKVYDENTYCSLIEAYGRNGKFEDAQKMLFHIMPSRGIRPSAKTGQTLISLYERANRPADAAAVRKRFLYLFPHLERLMFKSGRWLDKSSRSRKSWG